MWGRHWADHTVCALCDNGSVICAVNKKSAHDFRLLRLLCLLCALLDVSLVVRHLLGSQNASVHALCRNKVNVLFSVNPQASPFPSFIPPPLLEIVFNHSLRCTSQHWIHLLTNTFKHWSIKFYLSGLRFAHLWSFLAPGQAICPVSTLLGYLSVRPATPGPLFICLDDYIYQVLS